MDFTIYWFFRFFFLIREIYYAPRPVDLMTQTYSGSLTFITSMHLFLRIVFILYIYYSLNFLGSYKMVHYIYNKAWFSNIPLSLIYIFFHTVSVLCSLVNWPSDAKPFQDNTHWSLHMPQKKKVFQFTFSLIFKFLFLFCKSAMLLGQKAKTYIGSYKLVPLTCHIAWFSIITLLLIFFKNIFII